MCPMFDFQDNVGKEILIVGILNTMEKSTRQRIKLLAKHGHEMVGLTTSAAQAVGISPGATKRQEVGVIAT